MMSFICSNDGAKSPRIIEVRLITGVTVTQIERYAGSRNIQADLHLA
jgi:hypothetical protein